MAKRLLTILLLLNNLERERDGRSGVDGMNRANEGEQRAEIYSFLTFREAFIEF